MRVAVKAIKVSVPLKVSDLPTVEPLRPNQQITPVSLELEHDGLVFKVVLNGKSYRKTLRENAPEVGLAIAGKLTKDLQIIDAGIQVFVNKPPSPPP